MNLTEKIIEEFEKLFIPENKVGDISVDRYLEIIKGQKSFLLSSLKQVATEAIEAVRLEESPHISRLCQNQNGLDYCSTCEQAWEYCSCSARNTGFNRAISEIEEKAKKFLEENFSENKV